MHGNLLQQDLVYLEMWCSKWNMQLNVSKYTVLHIGPSDPHLIYHLSNTELKSAQQIKDLGVVISYDLKWEIIITIGMRQKSKRGFLPHA